MNTNIPSWTEVQINNIIVTNNSCELDFYQYSGGTSKFLDYDDVEFYLTSAASANTTLASKNSRNLTVNLETDHLENITSGETFTVYPNPVKSGMLLNIRSNDIKKVIIE